MVDDVIICKITSQKSNYIFPGTKKGEKQKTSLNLADRQITIQRNQKEKTNNNDDDNNSNLNLADRHMTFPMGH